MISDIDCFENLLILIVKQYIYACKFSFSKQLNVEALKHTINNRLYVEKYILLKNCKYQEYINYWQHVPKARIIDNCFHLLSSLFLYLSPTPCFIFFLYFFPPPDVWFNQNHMLVNPDLWKHILLYMHVYYVCVYAKVHVIHACIQVCTRIQEQD